MHELVDLPMITHLIGFLGRILFHDYLIFLTFPWLSNNHIFHIMFIKLLGWGVVCWCDFYSNDYSICFSTWLGYYYVDVFLPLMASFHWYLYLHVSSCCSFIWSLFFFSSSINHAFSIASNFSFSLISFSSLGICSSSLFVFSST